MSSIYNSTKNGYCRICGKYGKLSKDHIPPKKCFNESTIFVDKPYNIKIDKGLKIRSICEKCNNNLLGGNLDKELKKFLMDIDKYYKLKFEKELIFSEAVIKINKEKILRSILGHILSCYGTQEELVSRLDLTLDCYSNRMRQYVLGSENNFFREIRFIFWLHPYRTIKIIPNVVLTELYDSKTSIGGSLFSFYPIGIFIINKNEYSLLENFNLNEIIIDGSDEVKIDMDSIQDEDFPFSILKNIGGIYFLFDSNRIIHGLKSEYYTHSNILKSGTY